MREKIWRWLLRELPQGTLIPKHLRFARWFLYPLDCFYWYMKASRGYDPLTDTWKIYGAKYSDRMLRDLAKSAGETYKIHCDRGTVTMTRVR